MMSIYAIVVNGIVTNTFVWDGESEWKPEDGEAVLAPDGIGIGWSYADGQFSAPPAPEKLHDELVAEAEMEKQSRLDYATSKITVWQTKLLMGRTLTSSESAQLNTWMDYIDAVAAIDISLAPNITWPTPPSA